MGAGLVPVVSDIPSGVPEIVEKGRSGECPPTGELAGFADAIVQLDRDRPRLEAMSAAARQTVEDRYDIRDRVAGYQALYARWEELYRPVAGAAHLQYGSRLDGPWMPNPVVKLIRSALRRVSGSAPTHRSVRTETHDDGYGEHQ